MIDLKSLSCISHCVWLYWLHHVTYEAWLPVMVQMCKIRKPIKKIFSMIYNINSDLCPALSSDNCFRTGQTVFSYYFFYVWTIFFWVHNAFVCVYVCARTVLTFSRVFSCTEHFATWEKKRLLSSENFEYFN